MIITVNIIIIIIIIIINIITSMVELFFSEDFNGYKAVNHFPKKVPPYIFDF